MPDPKKKVIAQNRRAVEEIVYFAFNAKLSSHSTP
jgi:hypothetical protein